MFRTAACLAFACLTVHVTLAAVGGNSMLPLTAPMLALSAICATCGLLAWTSPTRRVGMTMVLGGIAMVTVHLAMMHHSPDGTMHMAGGTMHGGGPTSDTFVDVLMHVGVTLAGLQALVAVLAVTGRRSPPG